MNLKNEIFALLDSLKCTYRILNGIVYVTTPNGDEWDFTVPVGGTPKKTFHVEIREIHVSTVEVEAEDSTEAIRLLTGDEPGVKCKVVSREYGHTLGPATWTVKEKTG